MNTLEILVTCLVLSLDCFVVMMARGAMMNPQEHRRSLMNSLIFAGSSLLMIVLDSGISSKSFRGTSRRKL